MEAYSQYQFEHEDEPLKPGAGFPLIRAILHLNELDPNKRMSEVIIMSRNSADTSLRIFNSLQHYARNSPAHERVIRTLREWNVRIDEAFFLGGMAKHEVLRAFSPHIFFDDQPVYCEPASQVVPVARVLYKKGSNA